MSQPDSTSPGRPSWDARAYCFLYIHVSQGSPQSSGSKSEYLLIGLRGGSPLQGIVECFKPSKEVIELAEEADVALQGGWRGFVISASLYALPQLSSVAGVMEEVFIPLVVGAFCYPDGLV